MHVIAKGTLRDFWERPNHEYARLPLLAWWKMACKLVWKSPADVKATFGHASIRPSGRVVFNAAGNKLRIVTGIDYENEVIFVKWVGTHTAYDAIDVDTVDMTK